MVLSDFFLKLIRNSTFIKDEITFTNSSFVKLFIDNDAIENKEGFEDSLIYFEELKRSMQGQGKYLIFTCACGIADDGGWDGVLVKCNKGIVFWEVLSRNINWAFDQEQYNSSINLLEIELKEDIEKIHLKPENVVFPESW